MVEPECVLVSQLAFQAQGIIACHLVCEGQKRLSNAAVLNRRINVKVMDEPVWLPNRNEATQPGCLEVAVQLLTLCLVRERICADLSLRMRHCTVPGAFENRCAQCVFGWFNGSDDGILGLCLCGNDKLKPRGIFHRSSLMPTNR